ncbi:hypothetical protein HTZ84_22525 [Haloterrigena sp. SYSU A558-1]|uniref:Uncharacterized protein n=1 Tax=Haloterrigena gelatinilytica TaxID=2741724 RepID=A0ABX2LPH8_9EURY|nr:hypothetical protein [Haloterrigena gelatinilytica]NUC75044.1 hypothetical protein [Haloterrigena gelatinilytica]
MRGNQTIASKTLESFPEHLLPDGNRKVLAKKEHVECGLLGVDGDRRLRMSSDDGTVYAYGLETASVERESWGLSLEADSEIIADRQFAEEYMHDRDVSDWVWVSPRYEYLTEGP